MAEVLSRGDTSSAVLVGCHQFAHLDDLPAVKNNLNGLQAALTDPTIWGIPRDRVKVLHQPGSGDDVVDAVAKAADAADDTLVVYYSGHGLVDPITGELYMALPGSRMRPLLVQRALRFEYLRRIISGSSARKKVVLFDCCFSGRVIGAMSSATDTAADDTMVDGTCVITSASPTARSLAVPGEEFTAFTGVLLDILREGVPGAGPFLPMETVFHAARSQLVSRSFPSPQQSIRNTAGRICIARNRAPTVAPGPGTQESLPPGEQATPPAPPVEGPEGLATAQVRIYSAAGDVLGSGLLLSHDIVCTSAHTLDAASGVPRDGDEVPGRAVALDFPLLPGTPGARARVVSWPQDESNVALLRLDTPVAGSGPAPLARGRLLAHGAKFRAFGFPRPRHDGLWVSGEFHRPTGPGLIPADTVPPSGMGRGFSGAPVWNETEGGVAGIVMAVQPDGTRVFVLQTPSLTDERDRFARDARRADRATWAEQAQARRRERSRTRATGLLTQAATVCRRLSAPDKQVQQLTNVIAAAVSFDVDVARGLCQVLERSAALLQDHLAQVRALARAADLLALADGQYATLVAGRAEALAQEILGLRVRRKRRLALYAAASGFARIDPRRAESIIAGLGTAQDAEVSVLSVVLKSMATADPDRAERIARSLPLKHHAHAEQVLAKVAVVIRPHQPDRAHELVEGISDPDTRMNALIGMPQSLARTDPERAEHIALSLATQGFRSRSLSELVDALAPRDPHRAERIARAIPMATARTRALESVLKAMSRHDTHRAEHIARTLPAPDERDDALHTLVRRLASTDPDRAEAIARGFSDAEDIARALLCMVSELRQSVPEAAAQIALSMPGSEPQRRATALALTAQELLWQAPGHARRLVREAEHSARSITDPEDRDLAYSACAVA
ncbi:caspase, EACC1-associated type, partial [Streptomyces sp. NPDC059900]